MRHRTNNIVEQNVKKKKKKNGNETIFRFIDENSGSSTISDMRTPEIPLEKTRSSKFFFFFVLVNSMLIVFRDVM